MIPIRLLTTHKDPKGAQTKSYLTAYPDEATRTQLRYHRDERWHTPALAGGALHGPPAAAGPRHAPRGGSGRARAAGGSAVRAKTQARRAALCAAFPEQIPGQLGRQRGEEQRWQRPAQKYHLFAAAFTNGCGLAGWESNSEVIHAVSNHGPAGPFAYHDTALVPWHHNPQAVQAPDGTWLIYSIGQTNASWALPCKAHKPVGTARKQLPRVEVHYSSSLCGPWTLLRPSPDRYNGAITPFASNPAPIFLPNGTAVVVGTGFGDSLSVAVADSWRGTAHGLDAAACPSTSLTGALRT